MMFRTSKQNRNIWCVTKKWNLQNVAFCVFPLVSLYFPTNHQPRRKKTKVPPKKRGATQPHKTKNKNGKLASLVGRPFGRRFRPGDQHPGEGGQPQSHRRHVDPQAIPRSRRRTQRLTIRGPDLRSWDKVVPNCFLSSLF